MDEPATIPPEAALADPAPDGKKQRRGKTPHKSSHKPSQKGKREKDKKQKKAGTEVTRADRADKFDLYQRAVQSPEVDVEFFHRVFRTEFGRPPLLLREDFCGTAAVSCAWAASRRDRRAIGFDLDEETLAWGRTHNVEALPPARRASVTLVQADVREEHAEKADVICALNFSFNVFKTRDELRGYFKAALRNLADEGVLILDVVGGAETQEDEREESRKIKGGVHYVWEQRRFDPLTYEGRFAIHFLFKDGSALRCAFEYDWRLWTIPELRELLLEAGFRRVDVFWEGTDPETDEGNGKYDRVTTAAADPAWVACLAAYR